MNNNQVKITVTLNGTTAEYIAALSLETGTPIDEIASAILNGHRVGGAV